MKILSSLLLLNILANAAINNIDDFKAYKKLILQNDKEAYYQIGKAYYQGKVLKKSYKKAYSYLSKASRLYHTKATYSLGIIYSNKKTPYYDLNKAFEVFNELAQENDAASLNRMGMIYTFGLGKAKDYVKAIKYYEASSKLSYITAQCNLAYMYASGRGVFPNFGRAHAFAKEGKNQKNPICVKVWNKYNLYKYPKDKGWKFNFYNKP